MRITHSNINREEILEKLIPSIEIYAGKLIIADIESASRKPQLVFARALIVYLLRANGFTFSQIGYIINRDHCSVIYLLNKYTKSQAVENSTTSKDIYIDRYKYALKNIKQTSLLENLLLRKVQIENEIKKLNVTIRAIDQLLLHENKPQL